MKKTPLIFIFAAFMVFETLSIRASALSHQVHQDERLKAQDSNKDSLKTEVKFEGLGSFNESDLFKLFRAQRISVSKEAIKDSVELQKAKRAIEELLIARGYLHATVTIRKEPISETAKTITFVVSEGERVQIAGIQFEGNKIFSTEVLLDSMRQAKGNTGYACLPPEGYDSEIFDVCLRRTTFYLRSKGYLNAKLGEPKKQETEHGLNLIVPVTEGAFYRIGEIKIEGATVFTNEQILGMLNRKTGDPANGEFISRWLQQTLHGAYSELGYIQYEYDVDPNFKSNPEKADEGVVDFQITITEGARFIIKKIDFVGPMPMPIEELRRLLFVHEGEPFNQRKLMESVRNLYQLGLSDGDAERDVDYRTDEEKGQLNIVFGLKGYIRQTQTDDGRPVVKRRAPSPN